MFILPEERRGGEDSRRESELVAHFNNALDRQRGPSYSSTPSGNGLREAATNILNFLTEEGQNLHNLEDDFIAIAERLLRIRPSDRELPDVIVHQFQDYVIEF